MNDNKKKPSSKMNADDFDKTQLDVDVRKLEAEDMDKTQLIGRKSPPEKQPEKQKLEPPIKTKATEPQAVKPQIVEQKTAIPGPPFDFKGNWAPLLLWVFFSFFHLSLLIDALANASPLRFFLGLGLVLNLLFFVFCLLQKKTLKSPTHFGAAILLLTFGYSSYHYGSLDSLALTAFKKTPATLFNFIFLISLLYFQIILLISKTFSRTVKIVLSLFLLYSLFAILENLLYAFWIFRSFWNLEDNLWSSSIPFLPFYFRPLSLYFYFVLPSLSLVALFRLLRSKSEGFASFFQLLLCFSLMFLSQIILFKNSYPSFLGLMGLSRESTGMGFVYGSEKSSIQIQAVNYPKLKNNDLVLQQVLAASWSADSAGATDNSRKINLLLRNEEGRQIPFENKKDLQVLEQNSLIPSFKLSSLQRNSFDPKAIFFLVASHPALKPYSGLLKENLEHLGQAFNSKEKIFAAQIADTFKGDWLSPESLKSLTFQPATNSNVKLVSAFEAWSRKMPRPALSKISFLVATPDLVVSEEDSSKLLALLKKQRNVLFAFCVENECSNSLKQLATQSGGKTLTLNPKEEWTPLFLSAYSMLYPDYLLSYNFQGAEIDFQILSPSNEGTLGENSSLELHLNTPLSEGAKVVLSAQNNPLQEQLIGAEQNVKMNLNLSQFPKGKNTFKVTVLDPQGKQASKELALNVPDVKKVAFVRPLEGDTVSGQVNLEVFVRASLQASVSKVEFFLEDQKIGEALSEPYLITWDSGSQTGSHVLKTVINLADGSTLQDQIKLNFASSISTKILSPALGEYLNLLTEIEAEVNHPLSEDIAKVDFMADGVLLGSISQAPFKYLWDNSSLIPGKHYLQARAYSKLGSSTDSVSVNIGSGTLSIFSADNSGGVPNSSTGISPDYFEWVIDASKTMGTSVGGSKKIDWVKNALNEMLPKISSSSQHAFRWMGAQSPSSYQNCKDTQLYSSFKPLELTKLQTQWSGLEAKGIAPLAYTLEKARSDFKGSSGSRVMVLFTDAYENCGGDPVLELERWKKEKLNVKLYILGLDLEGSRDEIELKRIASMVGGEYFSIARPQDLSKALEEVIKVSYAVLDYKGKEVAQKAVGSEPLVIRTGEYRVEVNLEPPLVMEKVLLLNGLEKKLYLKKEGAQFKLSE
ncbi:MAG: hypothetical protein HQM15_01325 [Deltaproteobacteria bacterium]|nr:hypothetical protein [Deltaproteobacteria bacterium]